MLLENIPGYKEALADAERRQTEMRLLAFLGGDIEICGILCRQLTVRHLLYLHCSGSPFIVGGRRQAHHVAQFLWIVSPLFARGDLARRDAFVQDIALSVPYRSAVEEIDSYLDSVFSESPPTARGSRGMPPSTSFIAALIDELAHEYRWTREDILDEPLAAIYQYMRRIDRRRRPNAPVFNSITDQVNRAFLQKLRSGAKRKGRPK